MYELEYILCPKVDETVKVNEKCYQCQYWSKELNVCSCSGEGTARTGKSGRIGRGGMYTGQAIILGEIKAPVWAQPESRCEGTETNPLYSEVEAPGVEADLEQDTDKVIEPGGEDRMYRLMDALEESIESNSSAGYIVDGAELQQPEVQAPWLYDMGPEIATAFNNMEDPMLDDLLQEDPLQVDPLHEDAGIGQVDWGAGW